MTTTYTLKKAARVCGLGSYDTAHYWASSGILGERLAQGGRVRLTFTDLVVIKAVATLRASGTSLQGVRRVAAFLTEAGEQSLAGVRLVAVGGDVLWVRTDAELLSALRRPGQYAVAALVLDVGMVAAEVRQEVAKLCKAA